MRLQGTLQAGLQNWLQASLQAGLQTKLQADLQLELQVSLLNLCCDTCGSLSGLAFPLGQLQWIQGAIQPADRINMWSVVSGRTHEAMKQAMSSHMVHTKFNSWQGRHPVGAPC